MKKMKKMEEEAVRAPSFLVNGLNCFLFYVQTKWKEEEIVIKLLL